MPCFSFYIVIVLPKVQRPLDISSLSLFLLTNGPTVKIKLVSSSTSRTLLSHKWLPHLWPDLLPCIKDTSFCQHLININHISYGKPHQSAIQIIIITRITGEPYDCPLSYYWCVDFKWCFILLFKSGKTMMTQRLAFCNPIPVISRYHIHTFSLSHLHRVWNMHTARTVPVQSSLKEWGFI